MANINRTCFFFQQTNRRRTPKRYRKTPEELPQSLRFAHLNPKVAAYLASKEKSRALEDSDLVDGSYLGFESTDESALGTGRKSLLPEINETVIAVKHRLDSAFNFEESQRFLFEEFKVNSPAILIQLERILRQIQYDSARVHIPRGVECRLLYGYKDLSAEVHFTHRDWQTTEAKEAYEKELAKRMEEEKLADKDSSQSVTDDSGSKHAEKEDKKKKLKNRAQSKTSLADISEDEEQKEGPDGDSAILHSGGRRERSSSVVSTSGRKTRYERFKGLHDPSGSSGHLGSKTSVDRRSSSVRRSVTHGDDISVIAESITGSQKSIVHGGYYVSVIQFALSSKACEEKGWIVHDADKSDLEKETVLEWARQKLQLTIKESQEQAAKDIALGFDKPVQLRYYGDQKRETMLKYNRKGPTTQVRPQTALVKGMYPKIPTVMDEMKLYSKEKLQLFMAGISDGTMITYYPSGRIALLTSSAGVGKPGFYTNVFDDTPQMNMLATFTPTGRGCCYHSNGVIRFHASEKGVNIYETTGALNKTYKWPSNNAKLPVTINIHLNDYIMLRCSNLQLMQLFFTHQKETAKFSVGATSGAVEPKEREDMGHLLSGTSFSSLASKEYAKPYRPKPQTKPDKKPKNKKDKAKAQIQELKNILELPENKEYELEADRDLAKLQRKIKNLCEDWMEHYRIALGISSPHIRNMRDIPEAKKREVQSAKSTPGAMDSSRESPLPDTSDVKVRAPSAPPGAFRSPRPLSGVGRPSTSYGVKFDDSKGDEIFDQTSLGRSTPFPPSVIGSLTSRSSKSKSLRPSTAATFDPSHWSPSRGVCPVALQKELLGEDGPICKCSRHKIPYTSDVEYDQLIHSVPATQLIIISIVSTLFPETSLGTEMLEQLYSDSNKNRTRPCYLSHHDQFRIFKYDIATAAEYTNYTQPLLLRRHNVAAGMFLMYQGGKLLFCDHIFNGYGNERKDFHKQLMHTRKDALLGLSLPKDFRFSPSRGRHGPRSPWGGEIGGAGVDRHGSPGITLESAIFHRTESLSSTSSDSHDLPYPDYRIRPSSTWIRLPLLA